MFFRSSAGLFAYPAGLYFYSAGLVSKDYFRRFKYTQGCSYITQIHFHDLQAYFRRIVILLVYAVRRVSCISRRFVYIICRVVSIFLDPSSCRMLLYTDAEAQAALTPLNRWQITTSPSWMSHMGLLRTTLVY